MYFWSYYNRATAKQELEQHKDAILDFDKAIAINPEYGLTYLCRSTSKLHIGDANGSKQDFDTWSSMAEDLRGLKVGSKKDQSEVTERASQFYSLEPLPFARVALTCMLATIVVLLFSKQTLKTRLGILASLLIAHVWGYLIFTYISLGFGGA